MDGVFNVLKPPGMTSHDVVNYIRKLTGQKRVGHTGTLDPGAAGVLPVCIGKATKIIQYMLHDKKYRAEMTLGKATDTQDSFGELIESINCSSLTQEKLNQVLPYFIGTIKQVPPMASAVKYKGKKLYELHRAGKKVNRKEREVEIYDLCIVDIFDLGTYYPRVVFDMSCSAGTYVRTICSEVGKMLDCCAFMSFLLRTGAGIFKIEKAFTLEELKQLKESNNLDEALVNIGDALTNLTSIKIQDAVVPAVLNGNRIAVPVNAISQQNLLPDGFVKLDGPSKTLAIAKLAGKNINNEYMFQPVKVLA